MGAEGRDTSRPSVCEQREEATCVEGGDVQPAKAAPAVRITLANTASYEMDFDVEAITGRFVRGDASRSTDGNGLGLSIARSLTELQKGRMELAIDGDLFKAILRFPLIIQ